jgi:hypothetical protein
MSLFLRTYELIIGIPGSPGVSISNLNISFNVTKTDTSEQNSCEIQIWNMNQGHRDLAAKDGAVIILKAGYSNSELKMIFTGDIITASTGRKGADIVTTIVAGDGYTPIIETRVNRYYPKGTTVRRVVEDVCTKDFGIPLGVLASNRLADKFENGLSYMGDANVLLTNLLSPRHINWSIQDGMFHAVGTQRASAETRVYLDRDTGMIDSPESMAKKPGKRKDNPDPDDGIRVKSLLNPEIRPNKLIDIRGEFLNSGKVMTLKVKKVIHYGELEGSDWYTDVEAVEITNAD